VMGPTKHCFIHEMVREHKLNFVVLLETARYDLFAYFL
jgi:hypothetical protein